MISQKTIDNCLDLPIEDIIGKYLKLKRSGSNLVANCPFHSEKSSSFTVNSIKGIYKCFGCGVVGNGIKFVMEYSKLNFPEAIKEICDQNAVFYETVALDKEQEEQLKKKDSNFQLNDFAKLKFQQNLMVDSGIASQFIFNRGFSEIEIDFWKIGLAPDANELTKIFKESGKINDATSLGLIGKKEDSHYDVFRNRIIFPIIDQKGNTVGFGGRSLKDGYAKYVNTKDTELYEKSKILFGLFQNRTTIKRFNKATIVEGYADVISLWRVGITNAVAACGTAFTVDQARLLKKNCDRALLFYDGDKAGHAASFKAMMVLLQQGFVVEIVSGIPEGEDPDSLSRNQVMEDFIEQNKVDALKYFAEKHINNIDPSEKAKGISIICEAISLIPNAFAKEEYQRYIVSEFKIPKNSLKKEIDLHENKRIQDFAKTKEGKSEEQTAGLVPKSETQQLDFYKYGFWEETAKNIFGYIFATRNGNTPVSNFIIRSLFLIESNQNSKRIFEIENYIGVKKIIDIPIETLTSMSKFQTLVERNGNFVFEGTQGNLNRLKNKLYAEELKCEEVRNLGWQEQDNFFAFANGIFHEGEWCDINQYGIVSTNKTNYFLPSLSSIYANDRFSYANDKKFIHIKSSNTTFLEWSKLFISVHEIVNGTIGIMFFMSALFRDISIKRFNFFPHLFLFGPPATGKNQLAVGLISMFGNMQEKFNLNSGTKPGFFKKFAEFYNSIVFMDEYANTIDPERIQTLKGAYDGSGHVKSDMTKDERTVTTPIRSSCVIAGQQLPNADIALFTRVILLKFLKRPFLVDKFDQLRKLELNGLTSVTLQILKFRKIVEQKFDQAFDDCFNLLKKDLKEYNLEKAKKHQGSMDVDDRMLKNYALLLSFPYMIGNELELPVTFDVFQKVCFDQLIVQNSMISSANDTAVWWEYVEVLFQQNIIHDGIHFKIKSELKNGIRQNVLYIRFNTIHKEFQKFYRSATGSKAMDGTSLLDYLKNTADYIGGIPNTRFYDEVSGKKESSSAHMFNYDNISKQINLVRIKTTEDDSLREISNYTEITGQIEIEEKTQVPF